MTTVKISDADIIQQAIDKMISEKPYNQMSEYEQKQYHELSMSMHRAERIAKRNPNAIVNSLLDKEKNVIYEGVSMGGHIDPANNWYKENTYHMMDLSTLHGEHSNGLSDRINDEIVKPINDYLFERTGTNYVHDKIPNYKGYADVPNVYDQLFHKVCEEISFGLEFDFDFFAEEYIAEHKRYIDEEIEKKEINSFNKVRSIEEIAKELQTDEDTIKVDQDVPMPEEDMPSGSIN